MDYQTILTEVRGSGARRTGLITLNRPKQLNALSDELMDELGHALLAFDGDDGIGCIVVTGSDKAFAAGADIGGMAKLQFVDAFMGGFISRNWETMRQVRKPVIAAVAGFALGGGCELAMLCDFIIAADSARFGQPEIKLGIIPGAGGTQRLPRAVGKAKAMDLVLTARMIDAPRPSAAGLVLRVVPGAELIDIAMRRRNDLRLQRAERDDGQGGPSTGAYESPLSEGISYEAAPLPRALRTRTRRRGWKLLWPSGSPSSGTAEAIPRLERGSALALVAE
jgi:enoyl-CoA hydratase